MKMRNIISRRSLAAIVVAAVMLIAVQAMCQDAAKPPVAPAASGEMGSAFEIREMLIAGWPILSVLLLMSIISIAIAVERYIIIKRTEHEAGTFFPAVVESARAGKGKTDILTFCDQAPHSVSDIVSRMIKESDDRESMLRAATRMIQLKVKELETRVATLGTVANTAPFVGLLGTVIGIIKAFQSISATTASQQGTKALASGISEALVTTAFGLFVAIPAVILYNHLTQRISRLATDIDVCTSEISDKLTRK